MIRVMLIVKNASRFISQMQNNEQAKYCRMPATIVRLHTFVLHYTEEARMNEENRKIRVLRVVRYKWFVGQSRIVRKINVEHSRELCRYVKVNSTKTQKLQNR
jgi:hypothetical protein